MIVRTATTADIPDISRIYARSWKAAYRGMVPQPYLDRLPDGHWVEAFTGWFSEGLYEALLICDGQIPVGCAAFGPSRDEKCPGPQWAEIQSLYLLPEYIDRGYGKALFGAVLSALETAGFEAAYLWVLRENERARRFYAAAGFSGNGDLYTVEIEGKLLTDDRLIRRLRDIT